MAFDEYDLSGIGRGGRAVAALVLGGPLAWIAYGLQDKPGALGWLGTLLGLIGAVLVLAGLLQGVLYITERWLVLAERRRQLLSISPQSRILEAAAKLTPEQVKLVPGLDAKSTEVDVLDTQNELLFYLVTPEGRIPFTWLRDFLANCGVTWLYPVRNYSEGTPGYEFARAFTRWCVSRGYAFEASGSNPAQWASEQIKMRLMKRFGFEEETDHDNPKTSAA